MRMRYVLHLPYEIETMSSAIYKKNRKKLKQQQFYQKNKRAYVISYHVRHNLPDFLLGPTLLRYPNGRHHRLLSCAISSKERGFDFSQSIPV